MFSSYITSSLVNELIANPALAKLGGERREISILFSDIKNFTSFSEKHSPEEVVALLNEYLGAMTEVILKWEGTPDKFIGDAILAFWNAPRPCPDHAERAVRCALEMRSRLGELQHRWREQGLPELDNGIGINTGEAVVGNIGAEGKKMEYTAIGDQVNLGSRVESLTRHLDVPLLITETTLEPLKPLIDAGGLKGLFIEGLAKVIVKGRKQSVDLYGITLLAEPDLPSLVMPCPDMEPVSLTDK
jgi:adenylate cyclase